MTKCRHFLLRAALVWVFLFPLNNAPGQTGANPAVIARPTISIVSPKKNASVSSATLVVSGEAGSKPAVADVFYQLNGGVWSVAQTTNGWANWTATLTLAPGPNTLAAYAVDSLGRSSTTNSVKFVYVLRARPIVQTIGEGTVTPNYSGQLLQIGNTYSMTAVAAAGFKFTDWTGSAPTTKATVSFVIASNLTFTANFADVAPPANVIKYPAVGQKVTNALIIAAGGAKDNVGVAQVVYQLDGTGWNVASTTNGWANWSTPGLALYPGTNIIQSYAVDTAGNNSLTNTVKFTVAQVVQVLETTSEIISAAEGGTIALPSGSSVSIPPGVLTNDTILTLSVESALTKQPPGGLVVGVGPVLALSLTPVTNAAIQHSTHHALGGATPPAQPQLTLVAVGSDIPGSVGSGAMVDAVNVTSGHQFVGIPGSMGNNAATFYPSPVLFQSVDKLQFSLVNVKPPTQLTPLPNLGARVWNGTSWDPGTAGFDPTLKTLVLVHGMFSSVENAFGDASAVNAIKEKGGYQQVLGFDYDWTQGIDTSGNQLERFLYLLYEDGLKSVDIEAHSEGVSVALSAACQDYFLPIGNLVMLGGPIMGTPLAAKGVDVQLAGGVVEELPFLPLLTLLMNVPYPQSLSPGIVPPGETVDDILNGQFATDLVPGSSLLASDRQCVVNNMANSSSPLASTRLITVCGEVPFAFLSPSTPLVGAYVAQLFPHGFDGLIGTESASGDGAGFDPTRTVRLGCYHLKHTQLEADPTVISDVANNLNHALSPPPSGSTYTLDVNSIGTGHGTVKLNPPGPAYPDGTVVTLTADPSMGSSFEGWGGAATPTGSDTARVLMSQNQSATATFDVEHYTLTIHIAGNGRGSVTASPGGNSYSYGTVVTLSAHPASGSTFGGWSGGGPGTGDLIIVMAANQSVTANFTKATGGGGAGTWSMTSEDQTATWTVDGAGNFTGSGLQGTDSDGVPFPISITNGKMSGTKVTFSLSGSPADGSVWSGAGLGTLTAPFPNGSSASGSVSTTEANPLGTVFGTATWTATRQ